MSLDTRRVPGRDFPSAGARLRLYSYKDNPAVVCYSKTAGENAVVVTANTDLHHMQWSAVHLDMDPLGLSADVPYHMHDLLTGVRYRWQGRTNVVGLDPTFGPVHVFRVERRQRTEAQFEHFI